MTDIKINKHKVQFKGSVVFLYLISLKDCSLDFSLSALISQKLLEYFLSLFTVYLFIIPLLII